MATPTTNKGNPVDVPAVTSRLVALAPQNGPDVVWWRFWQVLWRRTGGHTGIDGAALTQASSDQAMLLIASQPKPKGAPPRPIVITIGASPYLYTAPFAGWVVINGGTVSSITFSRDGATFFTVPGGVVPVAQGDQVIVTYSVAPTMTMIGA